MTISNNITIIINFDKDNDDVENDVIVRNVIECIEKAGGKIVKARPIEKIQTTIIGREFVIEGIKDYEEFRKKYEE